MDASSSTSIEEGPSEADSVAASSHPTLTPGCHVHEGPIGNPWGGGGLGSCHDLASNEMVAKPPDSGHLTNATYPRTYKTTATYSYIRVQLNSASFS